jgi:multiple sugar transport system permease protein
VMGFSLAFTEYNGVQAAEWIGLDNVRSLWHDDIFWRSIRNSLIFLGLAVPARFAGALLSALLLSRPIRGLGAYRAAIFLPTIVPDIAWALIWLWILNPLYGPINLLLEAVGIPGPAWMLDENQARYAIAFMMAWQFGEGLIVCLAALGTIPPDLRDQSAVDGASGFQTLLRVVLPLLAPFLLLLLLRDTIVTLQTSFVPAQIVGRGGGPNYATTFLPLYAYTNAFTYLRFGYAAAMTGVLYALTAAILLAQYRVARQWGLGFRDAA